MSTVKIYDQPEVELTILENGTPITLVIGGGSLLWGQINGNLSNQTDLQNALNAKVPYSGATGNVTLGEYGITAGYVQLDTTPTTYTPAIGNIGYNDTTGTLETTLKGGTVQLKIGRDMFERVVNKTGVQLTKASYQAVRISDAQGQRLAVALAQANNDNNSADTLGLAVETIDNNQEGNIFTLGEISGINTTGSLQGETWIDGDVLYLSPTTAGTITNVKPVAPQHLVVIGYVVYAHANNGKIYVKVMNGWELGELHDVNTTGATAGQVLKYNGTIWAPSADAGVTGSGTTDYVAKFTGTGTIGNSVIRVSGTSPVYFSTIGQYSDNIFIGIEGISDVSATTSIGIGALSNITFYASQNTALGFEALNANENGRENVAVGVQAASQLDSSYNTAIGYGAMAANKFSGGNTAVGYLAMYAGNQITGTAAENTAVGRQTLSSNNLTGSTNLALGAYAGRNNTSGSQNIYIGSQPQLFPIVYNTTGSNNIFIGHDVRPVSTTDSNRTYIGNSSTTSTWLGGNLLLGSTTDAGQRLQVTGNVNFGGTTGLTWDNTNGRLGIGTNSPSFALQVQSDAQINGLRVGTGAGNISTNTIIGSGPGGAITSGSSLTFVGFNSGFSNTSGADNSFFGRNSGNANTSGVQNTFIGSSSGSSNTTGFQNVSIGFQSFNNSTGGNDVVIGHNAGRFNNSGTLLTSFNNSILIGQDARINADAETNQIVIGYQGRGLGSNTSVIGNSSTTFGRWWGNLLIGSSVNGGQALQITGLSSFTGTTASDGGQLGSELLSSANWTLGAGWTGDFSSGFAHSSGTATLTNTLAAVSTAFYQISYTVTNRTAGTFTIAFGGYTSGNLSATGSVGPRATSTASLVITPTTDFNGTIVFSIKQINVSTASIQLRNSSGTITNEIRNDVSNTNTFVGLNAGSRNLGTNNTFFGNSAGQNNTTGIQNTFIGQRAGELTTIGTGNSFTGHASGLSNTTGGANSFYGFESGFNNTTGGFNTFIGTRAGRNTTTGGGNVFIGASAGFSNTTGGSLISIGENTGPAGTGTSGNILIGAYVGQSVTNNNNVYVGGGNSTSGLNNVAIGVAASANQTTGGNNLFAGFEAGRRISGGGNLTVASNSLFIGRDTRANADSETNQTVIGDSAIGLGSNTTVIGNSSTTFGRWWGNLLVGTSTNSGFALDVNGTARIQSDATINGLTVGRGASNLSSNTVFGASAGNAITSGANNTFIGELSGRFVTTGSGNTFLGRWTGIQSNTSSANVFIGTTSGQNNTTGSNNTYVGFATAQSNTTSNSNSFFGAYSGLANTGSSNSGFGRESATNQTTGSNNIFFGVDSGRRISGGGNLTIANNSTFLGYDTRANADSETNQLVIGYQAIGNGSNTTTIGNTSTTNNYIFGNFNVTDANNLVFGTTTGTKIATATSQKLAFWNATPIVQPTTGVASATRVGGAGTTLTDTDTFDGYTLAQIVKALRNTGILA